MTKLNTWLGVSIITLGERVVIVSRAGRTTFPCQPHQELDVILCCLSGYQSSTLPRLNHIALPPELTAKDWL